MFRFLLIAFLMCLALLAPAPCLSALARAQSPAPALAWRPHASETGVYVLWSGETPVGWYDARTATHWPLTGRSPDGRYAWGEPCAPPVAPPVANFGIRADMLGRGDRISFSGAEVSAEQASALIGDPQLPDVNKLRVVAVGSDADTRAVGAALASAPELAPYRDSVIFQRYLPTHFHVAGADGKGLGYKLDGRPAVHVLAPDGTVFDRLDDFAGGAPALAASLAASAGKLRRPDPNYDPSAPVAGPSAAAPPNLLILGGLALAAVHLTARKGS